MYLYNNSKDSDTSFLCPSGTCSSGRQSWIQSVIKYDTKCLVCCSVLWMGVCLEVEVDRILTTGAVSLQITFSPNTVDTTSIDYFHVVAMGNISKSVIKCMGSSKGITLTALICFPWLLEPEISLHFICKDICILDHKGWRRRYCQWHGKRPKSFSATFQKRKIYFLKNDWILSEKRTTHECVHWI